MWINIFSALIAVCAICSLPMAWFAVRIARHVAELPHQRLRSCESKLQSVELLVSEHTTAIEDMANRIKMMKVRSATAHGSKSDTGMPDPYRDPEAWRKAMNQRIANNRLNGGG